MPSYLGDLEAAFKQIRLEAYVTTGLNKKGKKYLQYPEIDFNSQLKSELEKIRIAPKNEERYRGLTTHQDLLKNRLDPGMKPDLVLHAGPDNQDKQVLYVEIKTNPKSSLKKDLENLDKAVSTLLNFENGILIVANKSLDLTISTITKFIHESGVDINKLFLFHGTINRDQKLDHFVRCFADLDA
jgi:hypothetical protein